MNPAQPSSFEMFLPMIFLMGAMWFFMIRPQSKRMKEHDSFVSNLKRGDAVVTNSGILGVIDGMTDLIVTLEVAPNTKIKVLKKQIAGSQQSLESKKS